LAFLDPTRKVIADQASDFWSGRVFPHFFITERFILIKKKNETPILLFSFSLLFPYWLKRKRRREKGKGKTAFSHNKD